MATRTKAEWALLGITFIWGATFTITKEALAYVDPLNFLALRFILAATVLLALFWKDIRHCRRVDVLPGIWIGLILWISFTFQIKGLQWTTPSKSAFVTGFSVILVPLFEAVLRKKRPSWINLVSAATALFGLYLLSGTRALFPVDRGILLTFFCAIGFALHVIVVDRFARAGNIYVLVFIQIAVTALASSFFCLGFGVPSLHLAPRVVVAILITAILATALAFYVQNWAQKHTMPSRAAMIFSMEPVFAALVTYFMLHEVWTTRIFLGCALIFLGIMASELGRKEKISLESVN